jgi:heme-degrading monooxygenase HmoA
MKIMRIWHGWTSPQNADAYEQLLTNEILPGIHRIDGYAGAYLLRRGGGEGEEVEFITITTWDSWEAIERFSSDGHTGAVVPPKARALLARFDEHSQHYTAAWVP